MTTDTGIVAFLNARLDEEEAGALASGADDLARSWTGSDNGYEGAGEVTDGHGEMVVYDEGRPDTAQALHIARHDPARVLREVEAKRAILAAHGPDPTGKFGSDGQPRCLVCLTDRDGYEEQWEADEWPCLTLRSVAAIWSDHPDYDREWAL